MYVKISKKLKHEKLNYSCDIDNCGNAKRSIEQNIWVTNRQSFLCLPMFNAHESEQVTFMQFEELNCHLGYDLLLMSPHF